jgi:hypothetical protein
MGSGALGVGQSVRLVTRDAAGRFRGPCVLSPAVVDLPPYTEAMRRCSALQGRSASRRPLKYRSVSAT